MSNPASCGAACQAVEAVRQHNTSLESDICMMRFLCTIDYLGKGTQVLGPITVETCPGAALLCINKETIKQVEEVIAARTVDWPSSPAFRMRQEFFRPPRRVADIAARRIAGLSQRRIEERGNSSS